MKQHKKKGGKMDSFGISDIRTSVFLVISIIKFMKVPFTTKKYNSKKGAFHQGIKLAPA